MTVFFRAERNQYYHRCRRNETHNEIKVSVTKDPMFYKRRSSVVITMRVLFRLMNKVRQSAIYNDLSLSRNAINQIYEDMISMFDSDFLRNNPIQLGMFINSLTSIININKVPNVYL